ncbi:protein SENESCENCE-ASSOCIATED GENE 21, mitochondrial-like isoform X1 [Lycium barbarum]|uniref:protein SENESCENCE-ASSOCIATED GENE 21, mitochondrial-like isoform X1 n=1 Tax=Lycium barbarum TaxID=112863 RepID=UPI00293F3D37|nr:protein SENESCENCE-ASSOCIATED GENE 21, mitochondrial-like isoform X1 [Lycium barbarum]
MARSFSNVKLFSDRVSLVVCSRKGYAVAATESKGIREDGGVSNMMMNNLKEESAPKSPWIPDPVTGYYRPENQANQIDAVELRQMLLKSKFTRH